MFTWGNNDYGQIGDNTTQSRSTPVFIFNITDVISIGVGGYHNLISKYSKLYAWGSNQYGQLTPFIKDTIVLSPIILVSQGYGDYLAKLYNSDFVCGLNHTFIVVNTLGEGMVVLKVYGVGRNNVGQLGDNTVSDRSDLTNVLYDCSNGIDCKLSPNLQCHFPGWCKANSLFNSGKIFGMMLLCCLIYITIFV